MYSKISFLNQKKYLKSLYVKCMAIYKLHWQLIDPKIWKLFYAIDDDNSKIKKKHDRTTEKRASEKQEHKKMKMN